MASLVECLRHCNNSQKTLFKYLWELINPTTVQDNRGSFCGPWLSAKDNAMLGNTILKLLVNLDMQYSNSIQGEERFTTPSPLHWNNTSVTSLPACFGSCCSTEASWVTGGWNVHSWSCNIPPPKLISWSFSSLLRVQQQAWQQPCVCYTSQVSMFPGRILIQLQSLNF